MPVLIVWSGSSQTARAVGSPTIIALYLNSPQHAVVYSMDEKTAIQALDRRDPILPAVVPNAMVSNPFAKALALCRAQSRDR